MDEAAVKPGQRRRMHGAVAAVTAAAAIGAEQRLALLREGFADALIRQPQRIFGLLQDDDLAAHMGMLGAAEFGAEDREMAGLGRPEPHHLQGAGHDIMLHPKLRDEKAVDDVLRGQHEPHVLADRQVQLVDLALAAGMLDLPHPLLADDIDVEIGRRRPVQPDVAFGAPHKQHEEGEQGSDGPGDLDGPALLPGVAARCGAAAAIADAEQPDQPEDQRQDRRADAQLGDEQRIDQLAAGGAGARPERDPAHRAHW